MTKFTVDEYNALLAKVKAGTIKINISEYDEALTWVSNLTVEGTITVTLEK